MEFEHTWRQGTRPKTDTGFGWRTPLGFTSIASALQIDITRAGDNMFTLEDESTSILSPIERPIGIVREGEARFPQPIIGMNEREKMKKLFSQLVQRELLRERKGRRIITLSEKTILNGLEGIPERLIYYDKHDGSQFIYENSEGKQVRIVLML